ncbi:MAG TPA: hypothetical protein VIQ00_11175 [Chitinophagaceae bacterium]
MEYIFDTWDCAEEIQGMLLPIKVDWKLLLRALIVKIPVFILSPYFRYALG